MTTDKIIAQAVRSFPAPAGYRGRIVITAELHQLGNQSPYFSVTCAIGTARELRSGDWQTGGCLHDEALQVWPEIAPVVRLHLSDEDGVPMHAVENGFFWAAKAAGIPQKYGPDQSAEECLSFLANHLRVSSSVAQTVVSMIRHAYDEPLQEGEPLTAADRAKARFAEFVEAQKPRWQAEATAALELIRSFGEAVAA